MMLLAKDRLYLSGLKKIYKRYKDSKTMDTLLRGKVSLAYENAILHFEELGLSEGITHQNKAFAKNLNKNKTLDFILDNIK